MYAIAASNLLGLISSVWFRIAHHNRLLSPSTCVLSVETVADGGP
jgi:hypothetical protein